MHGIRRERAELFAALSHFNVSDVAIFLDVIHCDPVLDEKRLPMTEPGSARRGCGRVRLWGRCAATVSSRPLMKRAAVATAVRKGWRSIGMRGVTMVAPWTAIGGHSIKSG